jgi:hypothetical protein
MSFSAKKEGRLPRITFPSNMVVIADEVIE